MPKGKRDGSSSHRSDVPGVLNLHGGPFNWWADYGVAVYPFRGSVGAPEDKPVADQDNRQRHEPAGKKSTDR